MGFWSDVNRAFRNNFMRNSVNLEKSVEDYHANLLNQIHNKYLRRIDFITEDDAMKVPAVYNAVSFIAGTVAGLHFEAFIKDQETNSTEPAGAYINRMLNRAWNPNTSSYLARFCLMTSCLLHGKGIAYIARNIHNVPRELHVLDQGEIQPHPTKPDYWLSEVNNLPKEIPDRDIIYIPFMVSSKNAKHSYGILKKGARSINICLAIEEYLSGYFDSAASGNFAAEAPVKGNEAYQKFKEKISDAVAFMKRSGSRVLTLPAGTNFTTISNDSRRSQLVENRIESVRQIARFVNLPPVILGENSGTNWSLKDVDRFLAMHTINRWKNLFQQEFQLKLFPNRNDERFIRLDLSELQRAMLADRLAANQKAINSAQLTPNEAREKENMPRDPSPMADKLYIQSATILLDSVGEEETNVGDDGGLNDPGNVIDEEVVEE